MLTIWGRLSSINVQKVVWAAGEAEQAFERIDAGGPFGGLDTPEFVAMNPNRQIPVLRDGDLVMWESSSILRYLAARYASGVLWEEDPARRVLADRWIDWMGCSRSCSRHWRRCSGASCARCRPSPSRR